MRKTIYLASPHMSDEGYELGYIKDAFDKNWIAPLGENVTGFENEIASKVGIKHAAALVSGTACIHMALKAAGIHKSDRVFCQSLTFSATANPIIYEDAIPVFIDSEYETWNMSPAALVKAFDKYPDTRIVIAVNLYGLAAKLDEIRAICDEHQAILIEDAAESLGTIYKGRYTGTYGQYGVFSFNGNKIITTSGGGMLVSNDAERIEKVRFWSTQAREKARWYQHKEIGYNYRMSNIVAGIGRGQLKVLDKRVEQKRTIYRMYQEAFKDITDISMMPIHDEYERANCWLSCIRIKPESKVKPIDIELALEKENIQTRPVWKPMHLQPVFHDCDYIDNGRVSETIFEEGVCLPSDTKNTEQDMQDIISIIRSLWK